LKQKWTVLVSEKNHTTTAISATFLFCSFLNSANPDSDVLGVKAKGVKDKGRSRKLWIMDYEL
jgi:hypothetical protein